MEALYGAEPQFGASGSIFFACGGTSYYKRLSRSAKNFHWPVPVHKHGSALEENVTGIAVLTQPSSLLAELVPADLRCAAETREGSEEPAKANYQLVVSVSKRAMHVSVVLPSEAKLIINEQIGELHSTSPNEAFLDIAASKDRLLVVCRDSGRNCHLVALTLDTLRNSLSNFEDLLQHAVLDLGYDVVPISLDLRDAACAMILSLPSAKSTVSSNERSPKKKLRKQRNQCVVFASFGLSNSMRAIQVDLGPAQPSRQTYTTIACEENSICIAEGIGALHWWSLPLLDSSYDIEGPSVPKLEDLAVHSLDHQIRVHWHNATLSALKLRDGFTYSGGEQSRVICWNLESGQQKVRNWLIGDGSILRIQVPPAHAGLETRILVTTSTNKIYVIDTAKTNDATWYPQVIGPAIPVIYPAKLGEVMLLAKLEDSVSLSRFLKTEGGLTKVFTGFNHGKLQISILTFHQNLARVCAHDGDFRLQRIFEIGAESTEDDGAEESHVCLESPSQKYRAEGDPFSFVCLRSHKKHTWSRPEHLKSGNLAPLYLGAHALSDAIAFPELDLIVVATSSGTDIDRIHFLELWHLRESERSRKYELEAMSQTTLTAAVVGMERVGEDKMVLAFEDGKVHFSVIDNETGCSTSRIVKRQDLGRPLTTRAWRSEVKNQVMADCGHF